MNKNILIILLIILPLMIWGQSLSQKLEKPSKIFVGTPFTIHVEITTAVEDSIFSPQLDSLDVFFINGEPQQTEIIEDNIKKTQVAMTFQAFDTGDYTFPELEFIVKTANGSKILHTRDFVVIVHTVLADSAAAIKDIAKPMNIKLGFWDYFIPIVSLLVLAALIFFIKKLFPAKKEDVKQQEIIDDRPAWEIAMEMLERLITERLLDRGEVMEYYYRLSLVLRFFIERHYRIKALEMTTSEIRSEMKSFTTREKADIIKLLNESDRVKFAGVIPKSEQADELTNWLKAYLLHFKHIDKESEDA